MRVEGSKTRNTVLGGPLPLGTCFSTPMMVREWPSCCRYSGGLSASRQHNTQPSTAQQCLMGAVLHAIYGPSLGRTGAGICQEITYADVYEGVVRTAELYRSSQLRHQRGGLALAATRIRAPGASVKYLHTQSIMAE